MKKHLHKEIVRIGNDYVDLLDLNFYESVAITVVFLLSVTIGTLYGQILMT